MRVGSVSTKRALALMFVAGAGCGESSAKGPYFEPSEEPYGRSYASWAEEYWKWILSIPCDCSGELRDCPMHPHEDPTGKHCDEGNQPPADVWFLTGGTDLVREECPIPAGRAILIPTINAECPDVDYGTCEMATEMCRQLIDGATNLAVEMDGEPVDDPYAFRVSGTFSFELPECNYFGETPGPHECIPHDGYWYMIRPPASGDHELHFHGEVPKFDYVVDTTYLFTIE